jgi:hypothetical protein
VNAPARLPGQPRRERSCRACSADTAVPVANGDVRLPDAGVDCGAIDDSARHAVAPTVILEVLSRSARAFDLLHRLDEHKTVPSLRHIVLVNTDAPEVIHLQRSDATDEAWVSRSLTGLDAVADLRAGKSIELENECPLESFRFSCHRHSETGIHFQPLSAPALNSSLADLHEGLAFRVAPRLVDPTPDAPEESDQ